MAVKIYDKEDRNYVSLNFRVNEFFCHGSGCCSTVQIDPALVEYLQKIRDHFKKPVTINSGYRCPTHNKRIGGASSSRHTKGQAADISVKDVAPSEVAKYAESIGVKGIGLYETNKDGYFVHIDTRTSKSFWYGQKEEYRSTFGGAVETKFEIEFKVLSKGSKGEQVKTVQRLLIALGFDIGQYGADGDFGGKTEGGVIAFQKSVGLAANGVVDRDTMSKLLGV